MLRLFRTSSNTNKEVDNELVIDRVEEKEIANNEFNRQEDAPVYENNEDDFSILVVDDSKFSRQLLIDMLKRENLNIVGEAVDGLDAIDKANMLKPDVIFMDVAMPKMDGLNAVPVIVEDLPGVHIIMCTAMGQQTIISEALKVGAKDYVVKPYKDDGIISVLNTYKKIKEQEREAKLQEERERILQEQKEKEEMLREKQRQEELRQRVIREEARKQELKKQEEKREEELRQKLAEEERQKQLNISEANIETYNEVAITIEKDSFEEDFDVLENALEISTSDHFSLNDFDDEFRLELDDDDFGLEGMSELEGGFDETFDNDDIGDLSISDEVDFELWNEEALDIIENIDDSNEVALVKDFDELIEEKIEEVIKIKDKEIIEEAEKTPEIIVEEVEDEVGETVDEVQDKDIMDSVETVDEIQEEVIEEIIDDEVEEITETIVEEVEDEVEESVAEVQDEEVIDCIETVAEIQDEIIEEIIDDEIEEITETIVEEVEESVDEVQDEEVIDCVETVAEIQDEVIEEIIDDEAEEIIETIVEEVEDEVEETVDEVQDEEVIDCAETVAGIQEEAMDEPLDDIKDTVNEDDISSNDNEDELIEDINLIKENIIEDDIKLHGGEKYKFLVAGDDIRVLSSSPLDILYDSKQRNIENQQLQFKENLIHKIDNEAQSNNQFEYLWVNRFESSESKQYYTENISDRIFSQDYLNTEEQSLRERAFSYVKNIDYLGLIKSINCESERLQPDRTSITIGQQFSKFHRVLVSDKFRKFDEQELSIEDLQALDYGMIEAMMALIQKESYFDKLLKSLVDEKINRTIS